MADTINCDGNKELFAIKVDKKKLGHTFKTSSRTSVGKS